MTDDFRPTLSIDLGAIADNWRALNARSAGGSAAVIKADAYGLGAADCGPALLAAGAEHFFVATLDEGCRLRAILGGAPWIGVLEGLSDPSTFARESLTPVLNTPEQVQVWSQARDSLPAELVIHVDTGMNRLGCAWEDAPRLTEAIQQLNQLHLCGIYSHLALADGDPKGDGDRVTRLQQTRFNEVLRHLPAHQALHHLANSAGTLRDPGLHHDLVRVGLALYGHSPSPHLDAAVPLQPAMGVKARVTLIREVGSGVGVSYGHRFVTQRPSRLAVVGIGYADGVSRCLSGKITALHRGYSLPQVGAITMDQLILDATDRPDLDSGDVVTLLGRDGDQEISPRSWSELSESIPWEVLCGFKHRLPRVTV